MWGCWLHPVCCLQTAHLGNYAAGCPYFCSSVREVMSQVGSIDTSRVPTLCKSNLEHKQINRQINFSSYHFVNLNRRSELHSHKICMHHSCPHMCALLRVACLPYLLQAAINQHFAEGSEYVLCLRWATTQQIVLDRRKKKNKLPLRHTSFTFAVFKMRENEASNTCLMTHIQVSICIVEESNASMLLK